MKHSEARLRYRAAIELINYLQVKGIDLHYLNYALDRNYDIFGSAEKFVTKRISQRLKELEEAIFKLGKEKAEEGQHDYLRIGLDNSTPEDQAEYKDLIDKFNEFLEEESDAKPYIINPEKLFDLPIDYPHSNLLKLFYE